VNIKDPETLGEVRDQLCGVYGEVMRDPRRCAQVHEASNALGKVINACKVYLEYMNATEGEPVDAWEKFITGTSPNKNGRRQLEAKTSKGK